MGLQHSSYSLEYCYQEAFDMNTHKITEHCYQEAFDNTVVLI